MLVYTIYILFVNISPYSQPPAKTMEQYKICSQQFLGDVGRCVLLARREQINLLQMNTYTSVLCVCVWLAGGNHTATTTTTSSSTARVAAAIEFAIMWLTFIMLHYDGELE